MLQNGHRRHRSVGARRRLHRNLRLLNEQVPILRVAGPRGAIDGIFPFGRMTIALATMFTNVNIGITCKAIITFGNIAIQFYTMFTTGNIAKERHENGDND